jgi:serine/threonine protein kinase
LCTGPTDRRNLHRADQAGTLMADLAMDKPMLGDYRIEGIVGVGRMGVVYLAIDRITGRAVALKVLREDIGIDPVYRERFRREGELLSALEHPHVLPIYGMGEADGELFIAMRLVSSTLRSAISNKPIPVDDAMKVLACVASALDAAHAAGVVHRDVKPANVLIDPGPGEVYLADFGLARDPAGTALTAPGQVLGTIDYMAPELLDGERGRCDRHLRARVPGHRDADRYRPLPARH